MDVLEAEKEELKKNIASYPDFPNPGILFRDIFSLLIDPQSFKTISRLLENEIKMQCPNVDIIVGLDARGFILAAPLSITFMKPFVPIRKQKKLPGVVARKSFSLEYGEDAFEIQKSSIKTGQTVVIIDDLLATGVYLQILSLALRQSATNAWTNSSLHDLGFPWLKLSVRKHEWGTMAAAAELITSLGASVALCLVFMELKDLKGREKIKVPFSTIISF